MKAVGHAGSPITAISRRGNRAAPGGDCTARAP